MNDIDWSKADEKAGKVIKGSYMVIQKMFDPNSPQMRSRDIIMGHFDNRKEAEELLERLQSKKVKGIEYELIAREWVGNN